MSPLTTVNVQFEIQYVAVMRGQRKRVKNGGREGEREREREREQIFLKCSKRKAKRYFNIQSHYNVHACSRNRNINL